MRKAIFITVILAVFSVTTVAEEYYNPVAIYEDLKYYNQGEELYEFGKQLFSMLNKIKASGKKHAILYTDSRSGREIKRNIIEMRFDDVILKIEVTDVGGEKSVSMAPIRRDESELAE